MKSASTQGALKCAHLHDLSDGFRRLPADDVLWIVSALYSFDIRTVVQKKNHEENRLHGEKLRKKTLKK